MNPGTLNPHMILPGTTVPGLPEEMWNKIADYLEPKDLGNLDQVDKNFNKLVSENPRGLDLHKKILTGQVAQKNIDKLWNHPEANFDVSSNGSLKIISKRNLIGRFWKWIRNRDGDVTKKVQDAAKSTLKEAYRRAVGNKQFYEVAYRDGSRVFDVAYNYSDRQTIDEFACKLYHSKQFGSLGDDLYKMFQNPNINYGTRTDFQGDIVSKKVDWVKI